MSEPYAPTKNQPSRALLAALLVLAAFVPLAWSKQAMSTYFAPKFALVMLAAVWLLAAIALRAIWRGEFAVPGSAHAVMFALAAWTGFATLISVAPTVSFIGRANYGEGFISVLAYAIIFYAASSIDWTGERWQRLAVAFVAGAAAVAAICVLQLAGRDDLLLQLGLAGMGVRGRISGTLGNPVFLGGYATLALPITVALALRARSRALALVSGVMAVALLFLALASFTRASWLGIAVALVVFLFLGRSALSGETRTRALALAAVMVLVAGVTIVTFSTGRAGTMTARLASMARPQEGSASMRPSQWNVALRMAAGKPLTGWGPAQYRLGFDRYASLKQLQLEAATSDDAHNVVLNTAATTGIIGAVLLVVVLSFVAAGVLRERKSAAARDDDRRLYYSAAAAAAAGYIVWAMFNPSSVGITPLFWMLTGTLVPTRVGLRESEPMTPVSKLVLTLVSAGAAIALAVFPLRYVLADQTALAGIVSSSPEQLIAAIDLNPYMPPYYWALAKACKQRAIDMRAVEPLNEAEIMLNKAVRLSPEFDVYVAMAGNEVTAAEGSKNPDTYRLAVKHLEQALAARPLSGIARFNLGYVYFQLADYKNAAKWLREATKIPPPDVKSYFLLGQSLQKLKKNEEALAAYRAALKLKPDYTEAREAAARLED